MFEPVQRRDRFERPRGPRVLGGRSRVACTIALVSLTCAPSLTGCVGAMSSSDDSPSGRRGPSEEGDDGLDSGAVDGRDPSDLGGDPYEPGDGGADRSPGDSADEDPVDDPLDGMAADPFEIDLGVVTETATFDIPEGTLGFHLVLGDDFVIALDSPGGTRVVTDYVPLGWQTESYYFGVPLSSAMLAMGSASSVVEPGRWSVALAYGGQSARVRGVKTPDGRFHGGMMNLYVHIPEGLRIEDPSPLTTVSATSAPSNPAIQARIDAFFRALERLVGIDRGEVIFVSASPELAEIGSQSELEGAFSVSEAAPDRGVGLHMLFVHEMTLGAASGFAPSMPASMDPRAMNTIVMNITSATPMAAGGALLHELGHLAGLHHTTDVDASATQIVAYDPLTDTVECRAGAQLADCPDVTNVMFPMLLTLEDDLVLTPHQRAIIRAAPIYGAYQDGPVIDGARAAVRLATDQPTILEEPLLIHH